MDLTSVKEHNWKVTNIKTGPWFITDGEEAIPLPF